MQSATVQQKTKTPQALETGTLASLSCPPLAVTGVANRVRVVLLERRHRKADDVLKPLFREDRGGHDEGHGGLHLSGSEKLLGKIQRPLVEVRNALASKLNLVGDGAPRRNREGSLLDEVRFTKVVGMQAEEQPKRVHT